MNVDKRAAVTAQLKQAKIISIIRLDSQCTVKAALACLVEGGITALEITANTPGFQTEISAARKTYPKLLIGAGTITNPHLAKLAIAAGAQFLVTPNTEKSVIDYAHQFDVPVVMGALTPTEIAKAVEFSADIVKLFPAGNLGVSYLNSIKGPFKKVSFFAVGGINLDNIQDWMNAGVMGVGVGNDLTQSVFNETDRVRLVERVKSYVAAVSEY